MPRMGMIEAKLRILMRNNHEAELLVTTDWLAAHLDDPDIRVVDTRKGDGTR